MLRQEQLSEQFDVSRTPVREALRRLAALGLVSFVPNRGVRVRTISREELHEAFLVRAELESLATEVAAREGDAGGPRRARCGREAVRRDLAGAARRASPGEERRSIMGDWVRANHGFHDVIYRVADLPLVEQLAKSARRSFSGPAVWAPGDHSLDGLYARNAEQHRAIKQALAAGSATGARALAREHVLSSFVLLETILEQVGAQPRDWQRGRAARRYARVRGQALSRNRHDFGTPHPSLTRSPWVNRSSRRGQDFARLDGSETGPGPVFSLCQTRARPVSAY